MAAPKCWLLLAAAAAAAASAAPLKDACSAVTNPAPCGQSFDTQAQCEARGCCWDGSGNGAFKQSPCFYGGADAVPIKFVHIIQACHFDAGFADSTVGILNRWWYTHFPQAYKLGMELEANASLPAVLRTDGLRFMAQSYILSLFLDCPPNIPGLACPTDEQIANVTYAIDKGWITWHAFPHNGEAELMSPATLAAGIQLTHALDARFGLAPKATMSQRDVPGTTRSIIPVLLANGVTAISEGVNGASMYPLVPRMFKWRDPISGQSMPYLVHPRGYGGIGWEDIVVIPGFEHAFVPDWRGDNAGPPQSVQEVVNDWTSASKMFPGASVFYSTFDNFTSYLTPDVLDLLPVIEAEVGDTWIHGATSDPWKASWFRLAQTAREECLASGQCNPNDPAFLNATRHLLKNGEHTWGRDIKTFLHDQGNWTNAQLQAQLAAQAPNFITTQSSWDEQRFFGIQMAMQALPEGHPLGTALQAAWDSLHPTAQPDPTGWTPAVLGPAGVQSAGTKWSIGLDAATGSIGYLTDLTTGISWANVSQSNSASNPNAPPARLAWLHYQTYTQEDYNNFTYTYSQSTPSNPPPSWFMLDFGKPNVSSADPVHYEVDQTVKAAWQKAGTDPLGGGLSYLVHAILSPDGSSDILHTYYGAPADIWSRIDVPGPTNPNQAINVSVWIFDKTGTRLPESLFVRFNPLAAVGAATQPGAAQQSWYAGKLGEWVDATNVVPGGNQRHHGVTDGLKFVKSDGATPTPATASLTVISPQASVSCFGHPTGFPTPNAASLGPFDPMQGEGAAYYVAGNIWGTNYPAWLPWDPRDANMAWSFSLMPGAQ